jgi:hypothetical protein
VHIGEATVELRRGFDAELLREIVRALASAPFLASFEDLG